MKRLTLASGVASLLVAPLLATGVLASGDTGLAEQPPVSHEATAARPETGREASEARQPGKPPEHAGNRGRPDHAGQGGKPGHAGQGNRPAHSYERGRPPHSHEPGRPEHARQGGGPGQPHQSDHR